MSDDSGPHFHPISALPAIGVHVDAWLQEALEDERLFAEARPYQLDATTVQRALVLYGDATDDLALFEEQLRRWRTSPLGLADRKRVDDLTVELQRIRNVARNVLAAVQRLRGRTSEVLSRKSDLALGVKLPKETPEGNRKPPRT